MLVNQHISDSHPVINIPGLGAVRGELDKHVPVVRFLGIPFATVNKRWNPATPIKPWEGIRDAIKFGPSPPQPTESNPVLEAIGSAVEGTYEENFDEKDCLNVNIYMPHESVLGSNDSLPVMVWVYGGGYRTGGNRLATYDCTNLVAASIERKKPVVIVSINYRVGFFGFLASKEIKEDIDNDPSLTGEQKAVGNWALQDQKLAFLWVRDHIAAFRGDNKDITAFGESVGAESIACHMMIPAHHGLFQKAILQSGALLTLVTQDVRHEGQRFFDRLCEHFDIPAEAPGKEKVARLRAISEKEFAHFINKNPAMVFGPTVDGVLIDSHVQRWHKDVTRLDPGSTCATLGVSTVASWPSFRARLGSESELELFDQLYGNPESDQEAALINIQVITDLVFAAPTLSFVELLLKAGVETSFYFFDCYISSMEDKFPGLGAAHLYDLVYVFDTPYSQALLNEEEQALAKELRNVWLEFATTDSKTALPVITELPWNGDTQIIAFQRDLRVGRTSLNWVSHEAYKYWLRFFDYQKTRLSQGHYFDHGIDLIGDRD
ncbi:hypothetical protein BGW42_000217 [Actinomortierella wolfii]|nr:hypothetical protein BGW42_000217 [Actinomortierella wolfii]